MPQQLQYSVRMTPEEVLALLRANTADEADILETREEVQEKVTADCHADLVRQLTGRRPRFDDIQRDMLEIRE